MKRKELIEKLGEQKDTLQPAALILDTELGTKGVAIVLGEDLSGTWRFADLIVFWDDGDISGLGPYKDIEFIKPLFGVVEDENGDQPE